CAEADQGDTGNVGQNGALQHLVLQVPKSLIESRHLIRHRVRHVEHQVERRESSLFDLHVHVRHHLPPCYENTSVRDGHTDVSTDHPLELRTNIVARITLHTQ